MNIEFNKLIPELSVSDIEKSKAFYTKIGFKIKYERKHDKFAFLEYQGNQIMIEQINNNWNTGKLEYPFGRGINISMCIDNVQEYYEYLKSNKIIFYKKLMKNKYLVDNVEYEDIEFLVQDPDGYLLRFNN